MKKYFNKYSFFYGIVVPYIATMLFLVSCSEKPKIPYNTEKNPNEPTVIEMTDSIGSGSLTYKIVKIKGVSYYVSRSWQGHWILGGEVKVVDGK